MYIIVSPMQVSYLPHKEQKLKQFKEQNSCHYLKKKSEIWG